MVIMTSWQVWLGERGICSGSSEASTRQRMWACRHNSCAFWQTLVHQLVQIIVLRVHRPDRIVRGRNNFPAKTGNFIEGHQQRLLGDHLFLGHGADEGNLGHPRPKVIMNVLGDT